jgi:hypothetical protein
MRRLSAILIRQLLHAFCVAALVVSCGSAEALHSLGHLLTQTDCQAHSNEVNSPTLFTVAPASNRIVEVSQNETCWMQSLVSNFAQHSAQASQASPIPQSTFIQSDDFIVSCETTLSNEAGFWQSSRGPPAV